METTKTQKQLNEQDSRFVRGLISGDNKICHQFFYQEIGGILHKIRMDVFHGCIEIDEMVSELYLYLAKDGWRKISGFDGKNGCRLRTWMIPVAWRYFLKIKDTFPTGSSDNDECEREDSHVCDNLRIQIAIDVNAVMAKMTNYRYAEILRLLLIEGYSPQEVADMLGMRVANVYNLKHRAVTQFIALYGQR